RPASKTDFNLRNARWVVAQELSERKELQDVAFDLLSRAVKETVPNFNDHFSYGPGESLVRTCMAAGQREHARLALAEALNPRQEQASDDPNTTGWRARDLLAIGRLAQE